MLLAACSLYWTSTEDFSHGCHPGKLISIGCFTKWLGALFCLDYYNWHCMKALIPISVAIWRTCKWVELSQGGHGWHQQHCSSRREGGVLLSSRWQLTGCCTGVSLEPFATEWVKWYPSGMFAHLGWEPLDTKIRFVLRHRMRLRLGFKEGLPRMCSTIMHASKDRNRSLAPSLMTRIAWPSG